MNGFYNEITKPDGTPKDRFFGVDTILTNNVDTTAAIRECYGMIWWLAEMLAAGHSGRVVPPREAILSFIGLAQLNSNHGRSRGGSGE